MEESKAFKNFINKSVVEKMGRQILKAYPEFNFKKFMKLSHELEERELKDRVLLLTSELKILLPADYPDALAILMNVMEEGELKGFELWPFSEYIGQFGLEHFDESMRAMYLLTQKFTSEWAVRPFFLKKPSLVLKYFKKWARDKNVHVRRWVSEGSRPLLPWGARLPLFITDPTPTIALLEQLKFDEELYVRKSVANHLNDISKNHPSVVIDVLRKWETGCPDEHLKKINWIKHKALRTLIKKGNKEALSLMGVQGRAKVTLTGPTLSQKKFRLHDALEFQIILTSTSRKKQKLEVDYLIDFMKSNGKRSSKVFKLKSIELEAGSEVKIIKSHSLKPITTMTYYPGLRHLSIQVNGEVLSQVEWYFDPR